MLFLRNTFLPRRTKIRREAASEADPGLYRRGSIRLVRLCQNKLVQDPFSDCAFVSEPQRRGDPSPYVYEESMLAGAEAAPSS